MFDYQNRLTAALRSRGADEELVRSAVGELAPFDERELVSEFGEPEDYAAQLAPNRARRPRVGLIVSGVVLAVVVAIGLPVLGSAGVPGLQGLAQFAPLLALVVLGGGVAAEFVRYLTAGRSS